MNIHERCPTKTTVKGKRDSSKKGIKANFDVLKVKASHNLKNFYLILIASKNISACIFIEIYIFTIN
jgi:hypothetical protein